MSPTSFVPCLASGLAQTFLMRSFEKLVVSISRLGINDANVTVSQFPRLCHFYPSNAAQCANNCQNSCLF